MVIGLMISTLLANVCPFFPFFYETKTNRLSQILFFDNFFLDLRGKFSAIHREYSPNPRKFYAFCTSVTDTATTAGIIASGTCFFTFFLSFLKKNTRFHTSCSLLLFFCFFLSSTRHGDSPTSQAI